MSERRGKVLLWGMARAVERKRKGSVGEEAGVGGVRREDER